MFKKYDSLFALESDIWSAETFPKVLSYVNIICEWILFFPLCRYINLTNEHCLEWLVSCCIWVSEKMWCSWGGAGEERSRDRRESTPICVMRFWGCRLETKRWRKWYTACVCVCACPKKMLLKVDRLLCASLKKEDVLTCLCLGREADLGHSSHCWPSGGAVKLRQLGCQTWRRFRVGWFNSTIVHKYLLRL